LIRVRLCSFNPRSCPFGTSPALWLPRVVAGGPIGVASGRWVWALQYCRSVDRRWDRHQRARRCALRLLDRSLFIPGAPHTLTGAPHLDGRPTPSRAPNPNYQSPPFTPICNTRHFHPHRVLFCRCLVLRGKRCSFFNAVPPPFRSPPTSLDQPAIANELSSILGSGLRVRVCSGTHAPVSVACRSGWNHGRNVCRGDANKTWPLMC
jgi:hypothetical protein